jgi:hypothetical protein
MITNFTMDKIDAKIEEVNLLPSQRYPKLNISIDGVEAKNDKVVVSYTFQAEYKDGDGEKSKDIGHIKLNGVVELTEEKTKQSKIVEQWKDKGNLPLDIAEEVINGLNFRCSATGTLVAYSLGLIPPLVIGQTKISEPSKK